MVYELKNCPFCGGKVRMEKNTIICKKCGYSLLYDVFVSRKWYEGELGNHKHMRYRAMRDAWNTRVNTNETSLEDEEEVIADPEDGMLKELQEAISKRKEEEGKR